MAENEIKCSTWIQADIEQIWQAVNVPEQLAQWLLPPFLNAQIKRTNDDKAIMIMGPMEVPFMVFEASDPPHKVTIRGFPDKVLQAAFGLEEENGGTAVTVTMSGFAALPAGAYEDRLEPSRAGWEKALENLKAFTTGADLPFPQGYIASLLGYRLERDAKYAVERSIWLNASRERVWQAITDPQEIQKWYSPATPWRLSALEVGGKYTVYDAETDSEGHAQLIEVLDPLHQLVLRSMPQSEDEVHDVTTYRLIAEGNGTRLIIVNAGYEVDAVRHQNMEQNAFGFGMALENLQAFLAGEDLPYPFGF